MQNDKQLAFLEELQRLGHPRFSDHDKRQQFWIEALSALRDGLDRDACIRRAYNAITSMRRRSERRDFILTCLSCLRSGTPLKAEGRSICRHCHSDHVRIDLRWSALPADIESFPFDFDGCTLRDLSRLSPQETQVFLAITGHDDGPCSTCDRACKRQLHCGGCDNYLRRIGAWLGVPAAAVAVIRSRIINKLRMTKSVTL